MKTEIPLLTIAMPTYNRASSLQHSLAALIRQIDKVAGGWEIIEVIVSDNCSTDETPLVVKQFDDRPGLTYIRNSENFGMEGNFISCFEKAKGTFVWIFSDDDLLVDDALWKIVQLIKDKPVDIIYLPPRYLFGELDSFSSAKVKFNINRVSDTYFALRSNGVLSFLSAVVINKDRYLQLREDDNLRRYKGTFLAHYEWIYTILANGRYFYLASKPIIQARTGATGGYDLFLVFSEYYVRIGREKLSKKPRIRQDLENAMLYIHIPGFISRCRANNFGKFEFIPNLVAEQIHHVYGNSLFYRLFIKNQLLAPPLVSSFVYKLSRLYSRLWSISRRMVCKIQLL